jgi:hypothetical protein
MHSSNLHAPRSCAEAVDIALIDPIAGDGNCRTAARRQLTIDLGRRRTGIRTDRVKALVRLFTTGIRVAHAIPRLSFI